MLISSALMLACNTPAKSVSRWWSDGVEQALDASGTNRQELVRALQETPRGDRDGMQFLIENMPQPDLQSLSSGFLLTQVALAYQAFARAPWHKRVPKAIFLNDILPYASVDETRDAWRGVLCEQCAPLVADCKTPGEAAQRLNERIFKLFKVHYSTNRWKANQSALETMKSGLASCTGLSILLVDACRSVGVPARVAGTPMWVNMSGNHTWVEVWDNGWHFLGAAEPDPKGLDHAWFQHNASQALKNVPIHAIYASSFKKTGLSFPLDWSPDEHWVSAVNVTDRYAANPVAAHADLVRLLVKVLDRPLGRRVAAKVTVTSVADPALQFQGLSRDESADLNNVLSFNVPRGGVYQIRAEHDGQVVERKFASGANAEETVVIPITDVTRTAISHEN